MVISEGVSTTSSDRGQVDRIFCDALGLDEGPRRRFLEALGESEPGLRDRVDELLRAAFATDSLLVPGGAAVGGLAQAAHALLEPGDDGSRFGPYRVGEVIGRGGMGVVYRAERADGQYRRQVALKVIRRGADPRATEFFTRERQILATLQHPNIARLYDGGVTDRGEPYLVMELVDGRPIARYCEEEDLPLRRRLELFAIVCRAVQAAHRRLVVHRDLKPSNILVTAEGEVKLLDFGIAKLLDPGDGELGCDAGAATVTRSVSPQYASPEQFLGRSITVASDVYQLGLLAYELLTGRRPYDLSRADPRTAARRVCEQVPPPPSTTAAGTGPTSGTGRRRPGRPKRRREISGDLDTIVLKALRKEPEDRYGSADQLREDVERFLARKPILARPASWAYRLRKFGRRHALALIATVAVFLLIVGLTVAFARRLVHERDQTRLEAERTSAAQAEAEKVVAFLEDLFEVSSPGFPESSRTMTAQQLLEVAAERIELQLADQPSVRSRLLTTIGSINSRLGLLDRAESQLRAAVAIRESRPEEPDLLSAKSLRELALTVAARGRYAEARDLLERSLTLTETLLGADHPKVASILDLLANIRSRQGDLEAALGLRRRALRIMSETLGPTDSRTAQVAHYLATDLAELGRYDEAIAVHRRALRDLERTLGPKHPVLAEAANNLGNLHSRLGRHELALELQRKALAIYERAYGADHLRVATVVNNMGICLLSLGRLEEAERRFERALAIYGPALGEDHPDYAQSLNNLANVSLERGDYDRAETLYRRTLESNESALGPEHPQTAQAYNNLGEAVAALGRATEAEELFRRSLGVFEEQLGPEHLVVSWPVLNLARLHHRRGEPDRAEPLYVRALAIREAALEPSSEDRREVVEAYAGFLRDLGRESEAAGITDSLSKPLPTPN